MAVKPQAKVQRKRVKALTDPKPEFVSLVMAGANMTPFKAVKADVEGAAAAVIVPETPAAAEAAVDAPVAATETLKSDTHEIVQLAFDKTAFADEAAVRVWLASGNYPADTAVVERETDFVVGESVPGATLVQHGDVRVFLAERAKVEEKAEPTIDPETSPTAVTDVQPVAKSDAPVAAVVVASAQVKKSMSALPMLVDLVNCLKWVCDELTYEMAMDQAEGESDDGSAGYAPVVAQLKESASSMLGAMATLFSVELGEMQAEFKTAAPVVAPVVESPVSEAPSVGDDAPAPDVAIKTDTPVDAPAETPVVTAAVEPNAVPPALVALVTKLADSVQVLTDNVSRLHNEAAAKSDDLVSRVTAIETERQSRKGADDDEATAVTQPVRTQPTGLGDMAMRAALGIQRRAP